MHLFRVSIIILMISSITIGCGASNNLMVEGKVNIVTSFYPLYDFATKIGGEHVNVINLVPAGIEPHDWTPKPRDMSHITKADMFIYNGAGFEGWTEDFKYSLAKDSSVSIVEAIHDVDLIHMDDHESAHQEEHADEHEDEGNHDHGDVDPHAWISPLQAISMARTIQEHLIAVDPTHKLDYEDNYKQLSDRLLELHTKLSEITQAAKTKDIVVSHEAFGYIARDYGLNQVGVMGLSPDAEPTVQRMSEISKFVKANNIKYILFEELVSPKLAQTLAHSLQIETLVLNPIEGLTKEQEIAQDDYFTIMEANLIIIEKALQ